MASWPWSNLGLIMPPTDEHQQQQEQQQQTDNTGSSFSLSLPPLFPPSHVYRRGLTNALASVSSLRSILEPLPVQGPSPHARSSSPRHHSSISTPRRTTTTTTTTTTAAAAAVTTTTTSTITTTTSTPIALMPRNGPSTPTQPSTPSRRPTFNLLPLWGDGSLSQPELSNQWGDDTVHDTLPLAPAADSAESSQLLMDEELMNVIIGGEFSSPSTYPSFLTQSSPQPLGLNLSQASRRQRLPALQAPLPALDTATPSTPSLRRIHSSAYNRITLATSSRTNSSFESDSQNTSQNTTLPNDILNEFSTTPDTSFSDTMSTNGRRATRATPAHTGQDTSTSNKRRRTARATQLRPSSRQSNAAAVPSTGAESSLFYDSGDDLFGDSPTKPRIDVHLKEEEYTTIDLTEATEVPEELKNPEVDNRIKLSAFQCVICMDDATTLTVTHCGHLYCAQCLHSSLNVDATRGKCPMCRTKIDMKPRGNYTSKTKGFWPLELKLMTATRKGKRKAEDLS